MRLISVNEAADRLGLFAAPRVDTSRDHGTLEGGSITDVLPAGPHPRVQGRGQVGTHTGSQIPGGFSCAHWQATHERARAMGMKAVTTDFQTYDLHQAAYLVALRHPLRRLDGGPRKVFVFDATARADAERFHENAPVGAFDFAAALRQVKARLYAMS